VYTLIPAYAFMQFFALRLPFVAAAFLSLLNVLFGLFLLPRACRKSDDDRQLAGHKSVPGAR
jgi:hypothetical protein